MFIREKRNKSGSISVQVLQKTDRKNELLKTIGCSSDPDEVILLKQKARLWISKQSGMQELDFTSGRSEADKANRERGLAKLEKKIQSDRLTKSSINNRGYNKYLKLEGEITVSIDVDKFRQDDKWDGLKGYETNSKLTKEDIVANYTICGA